MLKTVTDAMTTTELKNIARFVFINVNQIEKSEIMKCVDEIINRTNSALETGYYEHEAMRELREAKKLALETKYELLKQKAQKRGIELPALTF